jgi:ABC-2 type transport system ATP-binding protein
MSETILSIKNVKKSIANRKIIKDISFAVQKGEIHGFLGPNGSGKSTTLRMIVGLLKPDDGDICIHGHSIQKEFVSAMKKVGCMIEGPDLYEYLSGYKNLEMLGSMSSGVTHDKIMDAVRIVGMENRIHDKISSYSMGMKQRLGLAQSLIHQPELLILDEPTNGLDPQGIYLFREIIKRLNKEREITVLLSSHLIAEVQLLCDRVTIINDGKIITSDRVENLLHSTVVYWDIEPLQAAKEFLIDQFNLDPIIREHQLKAAVNRESIEQINQRLFEAGFTIQFISKEERTLEELFLSLTKDQKIT